MSTTTNTQSREVLKDLVQILHDGQLGFRKASEDTKDPILKEIFSRFSLQRSKFAGELEAELISQGEEDPQKEGATFTGTAHRVWIDLKAAVTGNDRHAILAEAERGEDAAVQAYMDALDNHELSAALRTIISRQAAEVKSAHDEVKSFRDASKKA